LRAAYDSYSFSVLPWLGEKIAEDRAAYQYLTESIRRFPSPEALRLLMKRAGFTNIHERPLAGGIVVIHAGWKIV